MTSKVDIANLALSHIAQGPRVTNIDPPDGTLHAEILSQFYPVARDIALEMHAWKFATTRRVLTPITLPDAVTQWAFAYQYPNLVVRPLALLIPESTDDVSGAREFTVEIDPDTGVQIILTNVEGAVLKYIRRQDVPERYTPLFVNAVSHLLASFIAGPITKKASIVESQFKLYASYLQLATGSDMAGERVHPTRDFMPDHLKVRGTTTGPLADGRIIR